MPINSFTENLDDFLAKFSYKGRYKYIPFPLHKPPTANCYHDFQQMNSLQFVKETEPPAINSSIFMHLLFPKHIPYFCNIFSFSLPIAFFSLFFKDIQVSTIWGRGRITFSPLLSFYFSLNVTFWRMAFSLTLLHLVYLLSMSSPTPLSLWTALLISTAAQAQTSQSQLLFDYFLTVSTIFNIAL